MWLIGIFSGDFFFHFPFLFLLTGTALPEKNKNREASETAIVNEPEPSQKRGEKEILHYSSPFIFLEAA